MRIRSHEICTGCSCCLLSCPVWRRTRDRSITAQGRNRALQGGATVEDISYAIDSCVLCGACEANCPENNDIVGLTTEHRRLLNQDRKIYPSWHPGSVAKPSPGIVAPYKGMTILAGESFGTGIKEAVRKRLGSGSTVAADSGSDISKTIEGGLPVPAARTDGFIHPLRSSESLVVADGLLIRYLREWLPKKRIIGLGEALLSIDSIRRALGPDDLYVIECRSYHSDYARLVRFYDRIRKETGIQINLDLQRAAIPTGASSLQGRADMEEAGCVEQAKWILHGRRVKRIIVEDVADIAVFKKATDLPVLHVAFVE